MKTTECYHGFIEEDLWHFRYRTADDGVDTGAFLCGNCHGRTPGHQESRR